MRTILVVLALATPIGATELATKNRVENRDPGICLFACMESIGNEAGLPKTRGLCDAVMKARLGVRNGAGILDVRYWAWLREMNVAWTAPDAHDDLRKRCEGNEYVIALLRPWVGGRMDVGHAIVVLEVSKEKTVGKDGKGVEHDDYWVTIFDPNYPNDDWVLPWNQFVAGYRGNYIIGR